MRHAGIFFVLVILVLCSLVFPDREARAGTTERVSVASDGVQGNLGSGDYGLHISGDGRFVAFRSQASNLVEADTNGQYDIFLHDRQTGQTTRVSVASDGTQGNDRSDLPSISFDGRFVAFYSYASNLIAGDTNGNRDIFLHDRQTGETTRVSVASDGTQANGDSFNPSISADGRFVAFRSQASNLVEGDTNARTDIFVHDRQTGETTRVSVATDGRQANDWSSDPSISADGRFVAFYSIASNLVERDTNRDSDIFVHDRQTGETTRVSVASDGIQGNNNSGSGTRSSTISADGRFVAFRSQASNLVEGDTSGDYDIFVHDRQTGQTTRVSVATDGRQANDSSGSPSISADGRFVAFYSTASNLVEGDTNGDLDIFVHDRQTGQTTRVSVASDGTQGNTGSHSPSISSDGWFVAFSSDASNLVEGDTNGTEDVFVHDRAGKTLTITTSGSGSGAVDLSPAGGDYHEGTTVTLTAQPAVDSIFDHWEGDLTGSANPATILMDGDKNIVAHFVFPQLTVLSEPIVDVAITGIHGGTTPYTKDFDLHETVALTAPENVFAGGTTYNFVRWIVDEAVNPEGQTNIQLSMDADHTAVAAYQAISHTLTVQSAPIVGVAVTGDKPGESNYAAICTPGEIVTLSAPLSVTFEDIEYTLAGWIVDGFWQDSWVQDVQIVMTAPRIAEVRYGKTLYVATDGSAPFSTIQAALDAAVDLDTVVVRDGIYRGTGNRDLSFEGKAIWLRSENGPDNCIIDCEGLLADPYRAFKFDSNEGTNSVVEGFSIFNGYTSAMDGKRSGGAIYCEGASPTIRGNMFIENRAGYGGKGGGAIFCEDASPIITGNTFSDNVAKGKGGAIYCKSSEAVITGNVITFNSASTEGGGIYSGSSLIINDNIIMENLAGSGGGVCCYASSPTITDNIIMDNSATYGGGIYCSSSSPTIINNAIISNVAIGSHPGQGGGIFCKGRSIPLIDRNIISANEAYYGGGIYGRDSSSFIIMNSLLERNTASYGGAVYSEWSSVWIDNCTVVANERGRGLYFKYSFLPIIKNSIISYNAGEQITLESSTVRVSYSVVESGMAGVYVSSNSKLQWREGNITADPIFADPDNGDYHLTT